MDIEIKYFDLGIKNRDFNDLVTVKATKKQLKNIMLVLNVQQLHQTNKGSGIYTKKMWRSPNGTIRNIVEELWEPIIMRNIPKYVQGWDKPICIGRHAFGDQYKATDIVTTLRL